MDEIDSCNIDSLSAIGNYFPFSGRLDKKDQFLEYKLLKNIEGRLDKNQFLEYIIYLDEKIGRLLTNQEISKIYFEEKENWRINLEFWGLRNFVICQYVAIKVIPKVYAILTEEPKSAEEILKDMQLPACYKLAIVQAFSRDPSVIRHKEFKPRRYSLKKCATKTYK